MPWLTPDESTGGGYISRPLYIPEEFVSHVSGALLQLCDTWNWEQFGDITADGAAERMRAMLDTYYEGNPMIGVILPYATGDIPTNMLPCDGTSFARVDYPDLFAVLAPEFIDDADTFHTPDMDERFVMGAESDIGGTGGEASHVLVPDEMPTHSHPVDNLYGNDVASGYLGDIPTAFAIQPTSYQTGETGGDQAHNNLPPYLRLRYGMVYR